MNKKRIALPLLCLFLLGFTGVVYGTYTILNTSWSVSDLLPLAYWTFDLPAGDNITISITVTGDPVNFQIRNETGQTVYNKGSLLDLNDVWTVPAEGSYTFRFQQAVAGMSSSGEIVLGSEIIPEFQTWTSMLLIFITLAIAIVICARFRIGR